MALAILFFPLATGSIRLLADIPNPDVDDRLRPTSMGCLPNGNSSLFPQTTFHPSDSGQVRLLDFITIWTNLTQTVWLTVVYNDTLLNVKQFVWILPRENLSVNGINLIQDQSVCWPIRQAGRNLTIIRRPSLDLYVVHLRQINSVNDIDELRDEILAISDVSFNTALLWTIQGILAAPPGIWFFSKWRRSKL